MTITAAIYKVLHVEQKLTVLRLASNQSTLDQIRGDMRRDGSNAGSKVPIRKLSEREILALGNTAFHVYPTLTLKAPVADPASPALTSNPKVLAAAAAMSPFSALHLQAIVTAMNPTHQPRIIMNQSPTAFCKRVTYGVLAGLFIVWGLATYRPTTAADVEVAKIVAQSKLDLVIAQQAAAEKARSGAVMAQEKQVSKLRCVLDLTNTMTREFTESHLGAFQDLVEKICLN